MARLVLNLQNVEAKIAEDESQNPYWTLLNGEFPWCLDDSEDTDSPSELIGCFDLVLAEPPGLRKSSNSRNRTPVDYCHPEVGWVQYAELFLRDQGSLIIFSPLESVGAYVGAVTAAGLNYRATYIWNNPASLLTGEGIAPQSVEAVIWAAKSKPYFKPAIQSKELIETSATNKEPDKGSNKGKDWLIDLLIETFTEPEMAVLEPFATDGTVLAASQRLHRYCLGIVRKRSHFKQIEHSLRGPLKQTA